MVKEPEPTVFATEEPETVPSSAEAITATFAGPPMCLPATAFARSMNSLPTPVFSRNAPKSINKNIYVEDTPRGVPKTPFSVKYMWLTIWRTV